MNDKKNKSQNIKNSMNNTQEEQILTLLHNKLDNKYINIPNDENIKLLLQNDYIKNMILFTLNKHSELEKDLKIRKKISFYYINNQKIDEYIKKKSIKSEKEKKILELKNKLNNIREQRSKYKIENNMWQHVKIKKKLSRPLNIQVKKLHNFSNDDSQILWSGKSQAGKDRNGYIKTNQDAFQVYENLQNIKKFKIKIK